MKNTKGIKSTKGMKGTKGHFVFLNLNLVSFPLTLKHSLL
ncbi:20912_t:CDS:2 [Dentiscutata erythropus]|uniref:20912_t:CDS:1 n=1 Tax=Dentiscutata erythropus TaxID=1348616 RepID=A0A9N8YVB5_9GLOM|nr:20912_t:CDS:2 [Dentiscutata erythropus]